MDVVAISLYALTMKLSVNSCRVFANIILATPTADDEDNENMNVLHYIIDDHLLIELEGSSRINLDDKRSRSSKRYTVEVR